MNQWVCKSKIDIFVFGHWHIQQKISANEKWLTKVFFNHESRPWRQITQELLVRNLLMIQRKRILSPSNESFINSARSVSEPEFDQPRVLTVKPSAVVKRHKFHTLNLFNLAWRGKWILFFLWRRPELVRQDCSLRWPLCHAPIIRQVCLIHSCLFKLIYYIIS